MNHTFDTKEELVSEFIKTISNIDCKNCDEIENSIQKIVYKTRGLIHKDLNGPSHCFGGVSWLSATFGKLSLTDLRRGVQ